MRITKYNQSCLLVETKEKRILIDPGSIEYKKEFLEKEWIKIDVILITHRHVDHCFEEVIKEIAQRDNAKIYTSKEVEENMRFVNSNIVKAEDSFYISKDIKVEVTKAIHGFLMPMKYNNAEIKENIGFIIDDGEKRLYTTSDTIGFNQNYQCDILCMPFNGNGLTFGITDGIAFAKDMKPDLVIPIHMQHVLYNPKKEELEKAFKEANLTYKILEIGESITLE